MAEELLSESFVKKAKKVVADIMQEHFFGKPTDEDLYRIVVFLFEHRTNIHNVDDSKKYIKEIWNRIQDEKETQLKVQEMESYKVDAPPQSDISKTNRSGLVEEHFIIADAMIAAGWTEGQASIVETWSKRGRRRFDTAQNAVNAWLEAHEGRTLCKPKKKTGNGENNGELTDEAKPNVCTTTQEMDTVICDFLRRSRGQAFTYNRVAKEVGVTWQDALHSLKRGVACENIVVFTRQDGTEKKQLYQYAPERVKMNQDPARAQEVLENLVWRMVKSAQEPKSKAAIDKRVRELLGYVCEKNVMLAIKSLEKDGKIERVTFRNWHMYVVANTSATPPRHLRDTSADTDENS